jgi:hypothetical protein
VERNTIASITFNEAMNPVATTGHQPSFANVELKDGSTIVPGVWQISNGYKTLEFVPDAACAVDPCGNTIYCLPVGGSITSTAKTATLIDASVDSQARTPFDGVVDASGNALDGNATTKNGKGGETGDSVTWNFSTSNTLDTVVPKVLSLTPTINQEYVSPTEPIDILFNRPLQSSSVSNASVLFHPDSSLTNYSVWFSVSLGEGINASKTARIRHAELVSKEDGGLSYYPEILQALKGSNQFCLFPAAIDAASTLPNCDSDPTNPNCCSSGTVASPTFLAKTGACNAAAPAGAGLTY